MKKEKSESKKIIYSNQIKYYYFNNKYSISHVTKNDYDRLVDRYKASIERYKYIKKKYPMLNENDVSIIQNIARLYESKNEKIRFYLEENNALKIYKKLFSVKKIINCKISIKSKIKLFLFAVSPKLHNFIVNKYLKIKSIS